MALNRLFAFRMEGLGKLQMVVVDTFGFSVLGNLNFGHLGTFWTIFEILQHFLIIFQNFEKSKFLKESKKFQKLKIQNFLKHSKISKKK